MGPLVRLEVGALGIDLVASGDVAPVNLAPLKGIPALAIGDPEARAVSTDNGGVIAPAPEADARRQCRPLVVEYPATERPRA